MIFCQNVNRVKRTYNLSNKEVAEYFKLSEKTVDRILERRQGNNQNYRPSYTTVRKVADRLHTTTDEVFKYPVFII